MLQNVGKDLVLSKHGLLSTIGYKLGPNEPTYYALEVTEYLLELFCCLVCYFINYTFLYNFID